MIWEVKSNSSIVQKKLNSNKQKGLPQKWNFCGSPLSQKREIGKNEKSLKSRGFGACCFIRSRKGMSVVVSAGLEYERLSRKKFIDPFTGKPAKDGK